MSINLTEGCLTARLPTFARLGQGYLGPDLSEASQPEPNLPFKPANAAAI
jgi:hypothetical protein